MLGVQGIIYYNLLFVLRIAQEVLYSKYDRLQYIGSSHCRLRNATTKHTTLPLNLLQPVSFDQTEPRSCMLCKSSVVSSNLF